VQLDERDGTLRPSDKEVESARDEASYVCTNGSLMSFYYKIIIWPLFTERPQPPKPILDYCGILIETFYYQLLI
jgi:hypothetical protein